MYILSDNLLFDIDANLAEEIDTLLADRQVTISTALGTLLFIVSAAASEFPCPDVPPEMDREIRKALLVTLLERLIDRQYKELEEKANATEH